MISGNGWPKRTLVLDVFDTCFCSTSLIRHTYTSPLVLVVLVGYAVIVNTARQVFHHHVMQLESRSLRRFISLFVISVETCRHQSRSSGIAVELSSKTRNNMRNAQHVKTERKASAFPSLFAFLAKFDGLHREIFPCLLQLA